MIKREIKAELEPILSNKEIEVVLKRLDNKHITQTESNYLSRSVRPKLKSAEYAVSTGLLSLLEYRRRKYERDDSLLKKKIIEAVLYMSNNIKAIILFGSYIRNKHTDYRDIDVMIVLNKKTWKNSAERNRMRREIEKRIDVETDVNLIAYNELRNLIPYSPILQTELEEHKIIYGNINLRKDIIVDKDYLYKKLLESEYAIELWKNIKSKYLYNAIRNCLAIEMFLKKKIDNRLIIRTIEENIGRTTAEGLMDNKANSIQKEIAMRYLKYLYKKLEKALR